MLDLHQSTKNGAAFSVGNTVLNKTSTGLNFALAWALVRALVFGRRNLGAVIIHQDAPRRAFNVIELPRIGHSEKEPGGGGNDRKAHDDEQRQNFHCVRVTLQGEIALRLVLSSLLAQQSCRVQDHQGGACRHANGCDQWANEPRCSKWNCN